MRKKTCDKCGLKDIIMFRVKIDLSKKWIFLCKKCTDYSKKNNHNHTYGGTWKGKYKK